MASFCHHLLLRLWSGGRQALAEAARLINASENPSCCWLLASKPSNAAAVQEFIGRNNLAVLDVPGAGAISAHLFDKFGGR